MKFVVDMNLTPDWCDALRSLGHDCVHWSSVGNRSAPDTIIMEWAAENKHAVLTHDLDFGKLLALGQFVGPSVLLIRGDDVIPERWVAAVHQLVTEHEREFASGALAVLDDDSARVRLLPLRMSDDE